MKIIASLAFALLAACGTTQDSKGCVGNDCVCAANEPCSESCDPGTACHVQCAPGEPCAVACVAGEDCHVECAGASTCRVDCADGADCHVTCPVTGCTVTHISATNTAVTCGEVGTATISGTTATCP